MAKAVRAVEVYRTATGILMRCKSFHVVVTQPSHLLVCPTEKHLGQSIVFTKYIGQGHLNKTPGRQCNNACLSDSWILINYYWPGNWLLMLQFSLYYILCSGNSTLWASKFMFSGMYRVFVKLKVNLLCYSISCSA